MRIDPSVSRIPNAEEFLVAVSTLIQDKVSKRVGECALPVLRAVIPQAVESVKNLLAEGEGIYEPKINRHFALARSEEVELLQDIQIGIDANFFISGEQTLSISDIASQVARETLLSEEVDGIAAGFDDPFILEVRKDLRPVSDFE